VEHVTDDQQVFGFSWHFIDELSWWALGIALVISAVVFVPTGDTAFVVGCLVGAAVDVGMVRLASHRGRRELEAGRIDSVAPMVMVAGRLVAKLGLLLIAFTFPAFMSLAGTVVGILVFDLTLALVGSVLAASRTMRRPKEGR
jgi:hypothetical protein